MVPPVPPPPPSAKRKVATHSVPTPFKSSPALHKTLTALQWRGKYISADMYPLEVAGCTIRVNQHRNSELDGLGTGGMVWDAAVALCKYLEQHFGPHGLKGRRVIDIGSGTGIVGLCCAVLGADVTITDVGPVLQLIEQNCQDNAEVYREYGTVNVQEYWWGTQTKTLHPPYDIVLASECIVPKLYPMEPFIQALAQLRAPDSLVLVAYEHRLWHAFDPTERFATLCHESQLLPIVIPDAEMHPSFIAPDMWIWRLTSVVVSPHLMTYRASLVEPSDDSVDSRQNIMMAVW